MRVGRTEEVVTKERELEFTLAAGWHAWKICGNNYNR